MASEEGIDTKVSKYQNEVIDEQLTLDPVPITGEVSIAQSDEGCKGEDDPLPFISDSPVTNGNSNGGRRYPVRERRPPDRLTYT